jgi:ADP-ribose pyrophosphatase YjhB (NUDIX family)
MEADDSVVTAGAYLLSGSHFVFMVGPTRSGDRLGVVRLGGHVEVGETAWRCATREVHEEASVNVELLSPPATYWIGPEPERDETAVVGPWPLAAGEPAAPLLVAWRNAPDHPPRRSLSATYLARTEEDPQPASETQGLLWLNRCEMLWLIQERPTLAEFLRREGRAKLRPGFPVHLPLEPFLQLRVLSVLLERHPELAPTAQEPQCSRSSSKASGLGMKPARA